MKFKKGDRVRCVRGEEISHPIQGREYTIVSPLGHRDQPGFVLIDAPNDGGWDEDRFELIRRGVQVGDVVTWGSRSTAWTVDRIEDDGTVYLAAPKWRRHRDEMWFPALDGLDRLRTGFDPDFEFEVVSRSPIAMAIGDLIAPVGSDPVDHPAHYGGADDPYETIKVLRAKLTPDQFFGFCVGNAEKYIQRAGRKGDRVEDLEKARWYLDRIIKELKG